MRHLWASLMVVTTFTAMLAVLLVIFVLLWPGIFMRLLPIPASQRVGALCCVWVARRWVQWNAVIYRLLHRVPVPGYGHVHLKGELDPGKSYLLICNHQSWADILILFDVFRDRLPFLRFFLKRDLLWVPIVGVACWAMNFPFMKRHSREAIAQNPALANEDLETTRRACEFYRLDPVTVVNFPEGTRFTLAKRDEKGKVYEHLLRPKAAGLSFTLSAMGDQFAGVIDVTLRYQPGNSGRRWLWQWLAGEQAQVQVFIEVLPVPQHLIHGDYANDASFREQFQQWINRIWQAKDQRLAS